MCATAIEAPCAFANRNADDALALLPKADSCQINQPQRTVQATSIKYNLKFLSRE